MREEGFTFNHHLVRAFAQVNLVDVLILDLQPKALGLLSKLHHHLRTSNALGIPWEILNIAGEHQLPARHVTGKHEGVEHRSPSIEASRVASRSRTDDDDVANFRHVTLQAFVRNGGV